MDKKTKQPNSTLSLDQHHPRVLQDKRPSFDAMKQIDEVNSALYISDHGMGDVPNSQAPRSKTGLRKKAGGPKSRMSNHSLLASDAVGASESNSQTRMGSEQRRNIFYQTPEEEKTSPRGHDFSPT